ncbi:hypothetical protein [Candidatus Nardonella dryophthoridicola]|uniref:Poly A polymerase head domain-containing protein n=1 Tax=endosymbiont of Metamasius hemipterus TaxID=204627 RepID=A0ABT0TWA6_9GAMM|nr:hypothetical protein [Candidatus Nardonella dryophthoridicola]MCM0158275.1 hypothetical protein [endosymbiont of Metamasius hemipterus]
MLNLGFIKVGKHFPVFIHPITKEEYALARKEKKNGLGHKNFKFIFNSNITLTEDLYRRDITINAIAKDNKGNYIDPYNGIYDIKNKIIKHISKCFCEDPLRVLRVARFFAYLYDKEFIIDNSTILLMKKISNSGELSYLSLDRILKETYKALNTNYPECYFYSLLITNALFIIFPEFKSLINYNYNINIKIFFKIIRKTKKIFISPNLKLLHILYEINKLFIYNNKDNFRKIILNFIKRLNYKKKY